MTTNCSSPCFLRCLVKNFAVGPTALRCAVCTLLFNHHRSLSPIPDKLRVRNISNAEDFFLEKPYQVFFRSQIEELHWTELATNSFFNYWLMCWLMPWLANSLFTLWNVSEWPSYMFHLTVQKPEIFTELLYKSKHVLTVDKLAIIIGHDGSELEMLLLTWAVQKPSFK